MLAPPLILLADSAVPFCSQGSFLPEQNVAPLQALKGLCPIHCRVHTTGVRSMGRGRLQLRRLAGDQVSLIRIIVREPEGKTETATV